MLINGTSNDDDLRGTAENDTLIGSGGDDRLAGATGNDFLNGGFGDDTLLGGFGDDTITFGAGEKVVNGNDGDDVINLNFTNTTDDDFSVIYNSSDGGVTTEGILSGTRIEGIEELNVQSGDGNDNINISGASEGSVVTTGRGNDLVLGGQGDDELISGSGDDSINGDEGDDTIVGGFGDDILNGQSGDDVITFGAGANIVDGGGGDDLIELDFSALSSDVVLLYNQFEGPTLTEEGILEGTEIDGIEQADITTGIGDDLIDVASTTLDSVLSGGGGFDTIIGGSGDDELLGGAGNDIYFGNTGSDTIDGGDGVEDVAVFAGNASDYDITFGDNLVTLDDGTDVDELINIDFLRFDDGDINVETEGFTSLEDLNELIGAPRDEVFNDIPTSEPEAEDTENTSEPEAEETEDTEDTSEAEAEEVVVGTDGDDILTGDGGDAILSDDDLNSLDDVDEGLEPLDNIGPGLSEGLEPLDGVGTDLDTGATLFVANSFSSSNDVFGETTDELQELQIVPVDLLDNGELSNNFNTTSIEPDFFDSAIAGGEDEILSSVESTDM